MKKNSLVTQYRFSSVADVNLMSHMPLPFFATVEEKIYRRGRSLWGDGPLSLRRHFREAKRIGAHFGETTCSLLRDEPLMLGRQTAHFGETTCSV
jgi:hypothetical protein